jgi:hypothetical protein
LAHIRVEREEAEAEDPWGDHQLPPDILLHTVRLGVLFISGRLSKDH